MNEKELLESMRRRPGVCWGHSEYPFTSLVAFVSGVSVGSGAPFVPHEFHKFVADHFNDNCHSAKGWMSYIREHTTSEKEAFELFFSLLDSYERTTT